DGFAVAAAQVRAVDVGRVEEGDTGIERRMHHADGAAFIRDHRAEGNPRPAQADGRDGALTHTAGRDHVATSLTPATGPGGSRRRAASPCPAVCPGSRWPTADRP